MKNIMKLLLVFIVFFINFINVSALKMTGKAISDSVNIRSGASTQYSILGRSEYGVAFDILDVKPTDDVGVCASDWYKFDYKGSIGYICGDYVSIYFEETLDDTSGEEKPEEEVKPGDGEIPSGPTSGEITDDKPSEEIKPGLTEEEKKKYAEELKTLGFPESYIPYLVLLHEKHPTWIFEPLITGIKFDEAVKKESALGVSLIEDRNAYDGWKSTQSPAYNYGTDTWKAYDSGDWVAVNNETVAYFLDPRNFLTDARIFQFEKLNYDESYQTLEAVQSIFGPNSLFYSHAQAFIDGGKLHDVNAVYLAAKVRQEVGLNGSGSTSGGKFTYDGVTYDGGYYNVYNIGAYKTSAGSAIARGLYWAMGGFGLGNPDKYLRPWTSLDLSITGGAYFIASGYINAGQYTTYLQRFNVAKGYVGTSHQYQTDIRAPFYSSSSSYQSYYKNDLIDTSFKFTIPIYEEMPESTFLPSTGNPNHHLKELKVNDTLVNGFAHDINEYTFYVRSGATSVEIAATTINKNATVAGSGTILLTGDTTKSVVEVTAQNGDKNTYIINIVKSGTIEMTPDEIIDASTLKKNGSYISGISLGTTIENLSTVFKDVCTGASISVKTSGGADKTSGILGTGDVVTVTNGTASADYTIVIYGDTSGDGEVTVLDLLKIQKHILGYTLLNGAFNNASDVSRDNEITVLDLLKVQKHILGYSDITQ